ncbi:MAG: hypothetical protein WCC11_01055 [Gammaproteobacteria bacterium]
MLGDFLEISLSTPDILASVDFYTCLGFKPASVHDVWPHPYTVFSDGHVYLGLHQQAFPAPALSFVQPDLRRQVPEFEALGIEFEFSKLGEHEFNEAGFYAPGRQMVRLLEARTYSPFAAPADASLCGYFEEYRLAVSDLQMSRHFWEQLGLISTEPANMRSRSTRLATGGLNLRLWDKGPERPQLVFLHPRPAELTERLKQLGISVAAAKPADSISVLLTAPEGTQLLIVQDDS